jgi:hypothetical protein
LIEAHSSPHGADDPRSALREAIIRLSSLLPPACDEYWQEREFFGQAFARLVSAGATSMAEMLQLVDNEFAEFAPILKLAAAARPLVERLNEAPVGLQA